MTPADGGEEPPSLFEALAEPALGYRIEDGTARVTRANAAFEAVFGAPERGEPVESALPDDGNFARAVGSDGTERSVLEHAERRFLARDVAAGGDAGYVVYVDLTGVADGAETGDRLAEFADHLAHDLRNPIEAAKIHLDVVRETGETEHVDEIETALERVESIVQNGAELAHSDDEVTDPTRVAVGDVAESAWETTETDEATLEVADDLPHVDADKSRLQRLFENVFRNAIEHAGNDAAVRVGPLEEGDGFFVADDGPGVSPDLRERVFDSGFTTGGGNGFGLTIVSRIADAHGWSVRMAEAEGGGARLEVRGLQEE